MLIRKVAAILIVWGVILFCFSISAFASSHGVDESGIYQRLASGERLLQTKTDQYTRPAQPTVYITFDDGPSKHTTSILDILKKEQVKATFFVLGQASEKHPETIRRIVAEGHQLGNHTYDHRYEHLYRDFDQYWAQVQRTDDILQEIAGVTTRLHRAPGGTHSNFDAFYFYYMDQAGYEIYDWNVDSGDARRRDVPASEIAANVRNSSFSHEVHLLLHDSQGHAETVKALPEIIHMFREQGYTFAPLSEEVKPVHHSLGRSKWDRNVNLNDHAHLLASLGQTAPLVEIDEAKEQVPLQLKQGSKTWTFDSDAYRVEQGHIQISLRAWSEERNMKLHWNQKEKVAYLHQPHQLSLWKPIEDEVHIRSGSTNFGQQKLLHADMQLVDGRLYVPLRTLLKMEEMLILEMHFTDEKRTISIQEAKRLEAHFIAGMFSRSTPLSWHPAYTLAQCLGCRGTFMI